MPFKDIACHVWAIDGYVDDKTAEKVNSLYNETANSLRVANNKSAREVALLTLITHARQSELTEEYAIVYGGFRRGQKAPEHMWLEYNGRIYETMPGYALWVADATPANQQKPPLENEAFGKDGVAAIQTKLTVNQKSYLDSLG